MSKEATARSAMKLALEALESGKPMFDAYWGGNQHDKAITALREALNASLAEQPAQVSPLEFVTMTLEKEHLVGRPIIWAQWPNEEKHT